TAAESVLRRQAGVDAAAAGERRRAVRRHSPARVRGRDRFGGVRRAAALPDPPLPPVRIAGERPAEADEGAARGSGTQAPDAAPDDAGGAGQREPVAPLRPGAAGRRRGGGRRGAGGRARGSAAGGKLARAMMAAARVVGIAGLLGALSAGCGGKQVEPGGGSPTPVPPQISFTADLSTGTRAATVRIDNYRPVSDDLVNSVASRIRIATWPGDVEVSGIQVITNVMGGQLPNGAQQAAYAEIEETLDSALDGNAWYAISLPARPSDYRLPGNDRAFISNGGMRGVRFSPAHAPVVASVMSCAKDGGVVAVYARYSEPVTRAGGAP